MSPGAKAENGKPSRAMRRRTGRSPLAVGALAIGLIVLATYFGFTKHIPFTHGYRLKAVFNSSVNIAKNSPVRIAGVNVGKVKGVSRYGGSDLSVVSMELQGSGLPLHSDATLKIRPRIFLEGNFFVDINPGSPSAPSLHEGATIPVTQTSDPVQLDQVLGALQSNTRSDLQALLQGYGDALTHRPTAREDRTQDPAVKGRSAAASLNQAANFSGNAFRDTSIVNDATLGTQPRDLSNLIGGLAQVTGALDRDEGALQGLVTNLDTTLGAFAAQAGNLRASIRLLPGTLRVVDTALGSLNSSFPPTQQFASDLIPAVRETPATIDAAFPWLKQAGALVSAHELRGLSRDLRATVPSLASLADATIPTLPQADLAAQCLSKVLIPAGNVVLNDGPLTTGKENYKEFWYTLVGLAGESQNFDGNGIYVRFAPGGGTQTVSTGASALSGDKLFGNSGSTPAGTRPKYPGKRPPYRPDVPCYTQRLPDFNGPQANGSADSSSSIRAVGGPSRPSGTRR